MTKPFSNRSFARPLLLLATLSLAGCGGQKQVQIRQGSEEIGGPRMGALVATSSASIVHTDVRARIATVTLGQNFAEGAFLQALDREGQRTGLLRALPVSGENLRQLYILEGEPQINDKLKEVSPAEAQRLAEMYPDDKAS